LCLFKYDFVYIWTKVVLHYLVNGIHATFYLNGRFVWGVDPSEKLSYLFLVDRRNGNSF
jgi:hypothetical protein